jgi:hypothetical protein
VLGLLLISTASASLPAQQASQPVDLLLVDETQTFQGSLLVNLLAATLKRTGLFAIEAKFVEVSSSFDDPLGANTTDRRYEMVLVIPLGVEQGILRQIWIVTCPLTHATRPAILEAIETIQQLVAEGSRGLIEAVGVRDDAIPGFFATLFERGGWLACE